MATTRLLVDLDALVANWRALARRAAPAAAAAVVKADAYGLGIGAVAPALAEVGAREFFVATLAEGVALRAVLGPGPVVHVLNGVRAGDEAEAAARGIVPVVNSAAQLGRWRRCAATRGEELPLALQVDTGMSRFGMPPEEVAGLADGELALDGLRPTLLMSHLATGDTPSHAMNEVQRARFDAARTALRPVLGALRCSLAASSGIFLGPGFRYDLVRPGAALYGIGPLDGQPNPMRPVVRFTAPVMQLRTVAAGTAVGYGATWTARRPTRVATIACGYADGWLRSGGNSGHAVASDGTRLPVIGRVSMDSMTLDASEAAGLAEGDEVELIGPARSVDAVARDADTIGYEVLCALGGGSRTVRGYVARSGAAPVDEAPALVRA